VGVLGLSLGTEMAFSVHADPRVRAVVADSGHPGIGPIGEPDEVGAAVLSLAFEQDGTTNDLARSQ